MHSSKFAGFHAKWLAVAFSLATMGSSAFAVQSWIYDSTTTGTIGNLSTLCSPDVNTSNCGTGLSVSGYSTGSTIAAPISTTKFSAAPVYDWGSGAGLGVVAANEVSTDTGPHAIDNANGIDALMLTFTVASKLSAVQIGWNGDDNPTTTGAYNYKDSDLNIYAWTGSGVASLTSVSPSSLPTTVGATASGWTLVGNYLDVGSSTNNLATTGSTIYSSYWLVSAYTGSADAEIDAFKVLAISATNCTSGVGGNCPKSVPEPGSLALMGAAFVGLVATRRSKKAVAPQD